MTDKITTETREHLLLIGLNRAEARNRIDTEMIRGLAAAYTKLSENRDLRCGVIFAEGDDFCLGLDLPEVAPRVVQGGIGTLIEEGQVDPWGIATPPCTKPIVFAAHGRCFTAALELALAGDVIVAASNTVFGQMEVMRGIFPLGGATFRLPAAIGWHAAMRYILTGDTFDAQEAQRWGLVSDVTEPGGQLDAAIEIATRIAHNAPLGVQATLVNARMALRDGIAAAAADLVPRGIGLFSTSDTQEGILSLIERRPAKFTGE